MIAARWVSATSTTDKVRQRAGMQDRPGGRRARSLPFGLHSRWTKPELPCQARWSSVSWRREQHVVAARCSRQGLRLRPQPTASVYSQVAPNHERAPHPSTTRTPCTRPPRKRTNWATNQWSLNALISSSALDMRHH